MRSPRRHLPKLLAAALLLLAACALGHPARADAIFIDLDPGLYSDGERLAIGGANGPADDCDGCGGAPGTRRLLTYGMIGWGVYRLYGVFDDPLTPRAMHSSANAGPAARLALSSFSRPGPQGLADAALNARAVAPTQLTKAGAFAAGGGFVGARSAFGLPPSDAQNQSPASAVATVPNPEPATLLLLGTGAVAVAGAIRRRRKAGADRQSID